VVVSTQYPPDSVTGASPQIGDQIGLRYVLKAYVREREVIVEDNTKGKAKDFRFGVGQLLPGMDEAWKILRSLVIYVGKQHKQPFLL